MNVPKLRFKEFTDEWEEEKLENIGENIIGLTYSPNDVVESNGTLVLRSSNIKENRISLKDKVMVNLKINEKLLTKENDILICVRNGSQNLIGKNAIITKENENLTFGAFMTIFRSNYNKFIHQLFQTESYKMQILRNLGARINQITNKNLNSFVFYFPKLREQEKIADFLSSVDKKISITEEKLNLFNEYKKGIMKKIFNQELRFKDSNGNDYPKWEEKKLDDIIKASSSTISQNTLEDNYGEYIIYGATGEIKKIDFYDKEKEYIGIVKDGAGVGRCFYCKEKSSVLGTLNYLDIKENNNLKFCYYILKKIDFTKYIVGSSIPHIYFKDYKFEKIKLPCLEEQQKIADFLSSIDNKIEKISDELENLKEFKKGLLQKMFI